MVLSIGNSLMLCKIREVMLSTGLIYVKMLLLLFPFIHALT